jgi:hypothetical protein
MANGDFTPQKSKVKVSAEKLTLHAEGATTYKDNPVLSIDSATNTLTLCNSYKPKERSRCLNCLEYFGCSVYRRR